MLLVLLAAAYVALPAGRARATPSSTYWTPMTPDIQSYGVLHIGVDNYFTVLRDASDGGGAFPTDTGLTLGILPFEKVGLEVGVDLLEASDDPLYFNAKAGVPEGALFGGSPTLQLGLFNFGTKSKVTNQNIAYVVVGKSLPGVGRLSAGPYIGNQDLLVNRNGKKENTGFMLAFDRGFGPANDAGGDYNRFVFAADFASGKNVIGAGGAGIYYYFTKDISLLTGPVWFNEENINGKWKWTVQLDINRAGFSR
jgi:hypothetical protein